MTRYKATIAYDGTDFAGFQSQTNQRTVQKEIEKILKNLTTFLPNSYTHSPPFWDFQAI